MLLSLEMSACNVWAQMAWDVDQDGNVSWEEALVGLTQVINNMDCSEGENPWVSRYTTNFMAST